MKVFLFSLYKVLFLLLPVPLFFDLGSLSVFYIQAEEYNYLLDSPSIPLPIGAISLFLCIVLGYICSIIMPLKMISLMPPNRLFVFYCLVVFPVFIYAKFVSGLGFARTAQVMLPMLFLSMLSFPREFKDRLVVLKVVFLGACIFFFSHFLSIIQSAESLLSPHERLDFSSFFDVLIYQSLVSYPGVLSLYLFLSFAIIYSYKHSGIVLGRPMRATVWIFPFVLLYLLAASGRRAFLVEFISGGVVIIVSSVLFVLSSGRLSKRSGFLLILLGFLMALFFVLFTLSPLSVRVVDSIRENTFDSGRLGILNKAYVFFTNNVYVLFFGAGGTESPGFHNYVLDQVYRVGLIGFAMLYSINGYLVVRFIKKIDTGARIKFARGVFAFVLLSCLFWQSMINASISQPYYFVNFLLVSMLSFFVVFGQHNCPASQANPPTKC